MRANSKTFQVLLVEDSQLDIRLIEQAVEECSAPIRLHVIKDGESASLYFTRDDMLDIDMILLDLNLPRKTGIELLGEIRSSPRLKLLPTVVLSTTNDKEQIEAVYAKGANAFLQKPIDAMLFIERVRDLLQFWISSASLPPRHV